ncbi:MAG: SMI1/KNR4 family protein [Firmicutes bacterium]|nr:SMI1/KNR4 family protein [Bacillota bacterium]
MDIEEKLRYVLKDEIYKRNDKSEVLAAFERLNVKVSNIFGKFYMNYEGPFWSENMGTELLDIINGDANIEKLTIICRGEFDFPKKYLVLTELTVGEVIVFDSISDKVFRVDFEGGDEMLREGKLKAEWGSFEEFLSEYFSKE